MSAGSLASVIVADSGLLLIPVTDVDASGDGAAGVLIRGKLLLFTWLAAEILLSSMLSGRCLARCPFCLQTKQVMDSDARKILYDVSV